MKKITGKRTFGLALIIAAITISGIVIYNKTTEKLLLLFLIVGTIFIVSFFLEHKMFLSRRNKSIPFGPIFVNTLRVLGCYISYFLILAMLILTGKKFAFNDYWILFTVIVWAQVLGGFTHHLWRIILIYKSVYNPQIDIGEDVR